MVVGRIMIGNTRTSAVFGLAMDNSQLGKRIGNCKCLLLFTVEVQLSKPTLDECQNSQKQGNMT